MTKRDVLICCITVGRCLDGTLVLIEEVVKVFGDNIGIAAGRQAIFVVVDIVMAISRQDWPHYHRTTIIIVRMMMMMMMMSIVACLLLVMRSSIIGSLTDNGTGLPSANLARGGEGHRPRNFIQMKGILIAAALLLMVTIITILNRSSNGRYRRLIVGIATAHLQMHFNELSSRSSIGPRNRPRGTVHQRDIATMWTVPMTRIGAPNKDIVY
mmetsp:Transcript_3125/g.4913  ORF Transcript_3125/g.4913 Transcript_3125/m.4913 type:complete len:212 (-) Transcript_3125:454-1089(-)